MTLTIRSGEEGSEQTQTWELEVVGHIQQDASKGWWTQSNIIPVSYTHLFIIPVSFFSYKKRTKRILTKKAWVYTHAFLYGISLVLSLQRKDNKL